MPNGSRGGPFDFKPNLAVLTKPVIIIILSSESLKPERKMSNRINAEKAREATDEVLFEREKEEQKTKHEIELRKKAKEEKKQELVEQKANKLLSELISSVFNQIRRASRAGRESLEFEVCSYEREFPLSNENFDFQVARKQAELLGTELTKLGFFFVVEIRRFAVQRGCLYERYITKVVLTIEW